MTNINVLALENIPIYEQLQLEEALLRAGDENYCIINHKSPPAIVMGISGKREELIDEVHFAKRPIPIIRRFSGGGCVLINPETLFLTFICNRHDVDIGTCPKRLLGWTEEILKPCFQEKAFHVQANDYAIGDKKFGGNAQYFAKNRWLHHTSILWNYSVDEMRVLKMPPKVPEYRQGRSHSDFLICLNQYFTSKEQFFGKVVASLANRFQIVWQQKSDVETIVQTPHRKATELLDPLRN